MSRLDPSARVRNHIVEVLRTGPTSFDALVAKLVGRGLALGPDPTERIDAVMDSMNDISSVTIADPDSPDELVDVVFNRRALLDGTTWTIPIQQLDLLSDTLNSDALGPAFAALTNGWAQIDEHQRFELDSDGRRDAAAAELGLASAGEWPDGAGEHRDAQWQVAY